MSTHVKIVTSNPKSDRPLQIIRLEHVPDGDEDQRGSLDVSPKEARMLGAAVDIIFTPSPARNEFIASLHTAADLLDIRLSKDLMANIEEV